MKNVIFARFFAFLIDITVIALAVMPLAIISILLDYDLQNIGTFIILCLCIFKDLLTKNGSYGKKVMNLKVYFSDGAHDEDKKRLLLLRNLPLLIWPLEMAIGFFNNGKRIGDIVAKTNVDFDNVQLSKPPTSL